MYELLSWAFKLKSAEAIPSIIFHERLQLPEDQQLSKLQLKSSSVIDVPADALSGRPSRTIIQRLLRNGRCISLLSKAALPGDSPELCARRPGEQTFMHRGVGFIPHNTRRCCGCCRRSPLLPGSGVSRLAAISSETRRLHATEWQRWPLALAVDLPTM